MEVAQVNRAPADQDEADDVTAGREASSMEDEDREGGNPLRPSG